jgi:hypothetical protein
MVEKEPAFLKKSKFAGFLRATTICHRKTGNGFGSEYFKNPLYQFLRNLHLTTLTHILAWGSIFADSLEVRTMMGSLIPANFFW